MSSPSSSTSCSSVEEINYYCHKCNRFVTRVYAGTKCHFCRTEFIEEMDPNDTQDMIHLFGSHSSSSSSDSELYETNDDVFEEGEEYEWDDSLEEESDEDNDGQEREPLLMSTPIIVPMIWRDIRAADGLFGLNLANDMIPNAELFIAHIFRHVMESGSRPLSQTNIERIPVVNIGVEEVSDEMQCTVCMEKFRVEEVVRKLICEHCFHYECIKPWLSLHSNCPVCRQDLN